MAETCVAVLGTGLMGGPMARNLAKAGFAVRAWNRSRAKAEPLSAAGIVVCDSPVEAVTGAQFVITMLTDGAAVGDVLFQQGVASAMQEGAVLIDMSSIRPDQARDHQARLAELAIAQIDAPVSGGTRAAEAGTLAIMAGGDGAVFEKAKPVMSAMGRPVLVGPCGLGQLAKLANQAIVATMIGVVGEAMLLMQKGGGDPAKLREALKGGFADGIILQQHGERMTTGNFVPGGRSIVQLKDIDNILKAAQELDLTLPLTQMQRERFHRLCHELGGAELDHSALYLELLDRNNISV
ncbi:MAG: NAD(P)-dependent oxidoreductase [Nitratireductor sp.]|nr:NAD(P)-dependent oxidoreductase [Nitratireductor sp.]MCB1456831.1 NAD(P)-dependent oxidoreductase [Nitratireductor sp.]